MSILNKKLTRPLIPRLYQRYEMIATRELLVISSPTSRSLRSGTALLDPQFDSRFQIGTDSYAGLLIEKGKKVMQDRRADYRQIQRWNNCGKLVSLFRFRPNIRS